MGYDLERKQFFLSSQVAMVLHGFGIFDSLAAF